ncbi:MAG: hypothetical protein IJB43_05080 [Clostridia bacterium]|nr:hypothetical protein [Clostridia bacterium]
MKKNNVAKYFSQKSFSVLDLICIAMAVIGAIVGTVVWGGGPIGFGLLGISIVILVISRSTRAKDEEVDKELERLLGENGIDTAAKNTVSGFDLEATVIRGKDQKLRSERYFVTSFDFLEDKIAVKSLCFDLINGTVTENLYEIGKGERASLIETAVPKASNKKSCRLYCESFGGAGVPVSLDDLESSKLIEKVCAPGEKKN